MVLHQLRFYRSKLALISVLILLGCALFNCYMPKFSAQSGADLSSIDSVAVSKMTPASHCNTLTGCLLEASLGLSISLLALACFIVLFGAAHFKNTITLAIRHYAFRSEASFLHLYNFPRLHLTYCTWLN
ncbi:MAG: hypothetical protein OFPI_06940 [Osedax symbiont Rs2]|nr:MAG: hypothetical protein OFPI_06940 [Osedax symbiont Rs2]